MRCHGIAERGTSKARKGKQKTAGSLPGSLPDIRGNHLSNTTGLTHGFFKRGESCSNFGGLITRIIIIIIIIIITMIIQ